MRLGGFFSENPENLADAKELTSKLCGKQLTEKYKKVEDKSDGGAHCHTEARKLFRSRFQMLAMQLSWDQQPINFPESVFGD